MGLYLYQNLNPQHNVPQTTSEMTHLVRERKTRLTVPPEPVLRTEGLAFIGTTVRNSVYWPTTRHIFQTHYCRLCRVICRILSITAQLSANGCLKNFFSRTVMISTVRRGRSAGGTTFCDKQGKGHGPVFVSSKLCLRTKTLSNNWSKPEYTLRCAPA